MDFDVIIKNTKETTEAFEKLKNTKGFSDDFIKMNYIKQEDTYDLQMQISKHNFDYTEGFDHFKALETAAFHVNGGLLYEQNSGNLMLQSEFADVNFYMANANKIFEEIFHDQFGYNCKSISNIRLSNFFQVLKNDKTVKNDRINSAFVKEFENVVNDNNNSNKTRPTLLDILFENRKNNNNSGNVKYSFNINDLDKFMVSWNKVTMDLAEAYANFMSTVKIAKNSIYNNINNRPEVLKFTTHIASCKVVKNVIDNDPNYKKLKFHFTENSGFDAPAYHISNLNIFFSSGIRKLLSENIIVEQNGNERHSYTTDDAWNIGMTLNGLEMYNETLQIGDRNRYDFPDFVDTYEYTTHLHTIKKIGYTKSKGDPITQTLATVKMVKNTVDQATTKDKKISFQKTIDKLNSLADNENDTSELNTIIGNYILTKNVKKAFVNLFH